MLQSALNWEVFFLQQLSGAHLPAPIISAAVQRRRPAAAHTSCASVCESGPTRWHPGTCQVYRRHSPTRCQGHLWRSLALWFGAKSCLFTEQQARPNAL